MRVTESGVRAAPADVCTTSGVGPDQSARADATSSPVRLVCASCDAARSPSASFCQGCGKSFAPAATRGEVAAGLRAERRRVTILFCDLVDSVSLCAGQDPEDVAEAMRQFHAALASTMLRFGGYLERPMGDGGLFYFGYPAASEDDCERAVAAALASIESIERLPPQLGRSIRVRVGISTGVVVVSDLLGAAERAGHDIVGDVANLAARLQQTATPGSVLVSDPVRRLTRAAFDYEDMGSSHLRGWADPIRLWRPVKHVRRPDRFGARFAEGASPIVGRARELAELADAWKQARGGVGGVVLLTGEPGFGKSRLLHELVASLGPGGAEVTRYLCAPMEQEAALYPVIEQLRYEAGLTAQDDRPTCREKVAAALADCPQPEATLISSLIAPELAEAVSGRTQASPERQQDLILSALLAQLLRSAAIGPLCLVVEDAHWSDPTTRALLGRVAAAAPSHALLLVVAARPQYRPDWAEDPGVRRLQLDPLASEESERLVHAAAGAMRLDDDVVADIVVRSDGVPLFIEEVTRAVIEPNSADQDVPASIHASLLSRIDGLGRARALAEVAATIGRAFGLALLTAVYDAPAAEFSEDLARLIESGLVQDEESSGGAVFVFRHALIRDAAYGTIVRGKRRELHGRIAETMEREFPAEAALHPQQLAHHHGAAARDQQAATWWLRAGLQALQRSAMTEAMTQLRRALALLDRVTRDDDEGRLKLMLEVLVVYGKALTVTQGHVAEPTLKAVSRARALCTRLPDAPEVITVLFLSWTQSFFGGRLIKAEARASELLHAGERRGDDAAKFLGGYVLGLTRLLRGDLQDSGRLLQEAAARFDPARRDQYARPSIGDPHVIMRTYLGWGAAMRGAFSEAAAHHAVAISEAAMLRQPFATSLALCTRLYVVTELHGAISATEMLHDLEAAAAGVAHFEALVKIARGWLVAASGDCEAGRDWSRRGRLQQAAGGTRLHHSTFLRMEAEMLLSTGHVSEALEELKTAERLQAESGEHWDGPEFNRVRAQALVLLSRTDEAEAELLAAERLASCRGQHVFGLRAATARARLLVRRGKNAQAAKLVRRRLDLVEYDETAVDVAAAVRLVEDLAAGP